MTGNLFDQNPVTRQPVVNPAARAKDPASSHEAAKRMKDSGRAQAHAIRVLGFLRSKYPEKFTSAEIAAEIPELDRYEVARRLSELKKAKQVSSSEDYKRECRVGGRKAVTWIATPQ